MSGSREGAKRKTHLHRREFCVGSVNRDLDLVGARRVSLHPWHLEQSESVRNLVFRGRVDRLQGSLNGATLAFLDDGSQHGGSLRVGVEDNKGIEELHGSAVAERQRGSESGADGVDEGEHLAGPLVVVRRGLLVLVALVRKRDEARRQHQARDLVGLKVGEIVADILRLIGLSLEVGLAIELEAFEAGLDLGFGDPGGLVRATAGALHDQVLQELKEPLVRLAADLNKVVACAPVLELVTRLQRPFRLPRARCKLRDEVGERPQLA